MPYFATYTLEEATSSSGLSVGFDVLESSAFTLAGQLSSHFALAFGASAETATTATVRLEQVAGGVVHESQTSLVDSGCPEFEPCDDALTVDASGLLAPGRYVLVAEARGSAGCLASVSTQTLVGQLQESAFDVTLTLTPAAAAPVASPGLLGLLMCALAGVGVFRLRAGNR